MSTRPTEMPNTAALYRTYCAESCELASTELRTMCCDPEDDRNNWWYTFFITVFIYGMCASVGVLIYVAWYTTQC